MKFLHTLSRTIALVTIAATIACQPEPLPILLPTDDAPIATTEDFRPFQISTQEVNQITARYLAVTSWGQTVSNTAQENPALFPAALFTAPSDDCVSRFITLYDLNPNTDPRRINQCHLDSYEHLDPNEWHKRHADEQQGRIRVAVTYLWNSLDYRQLTIAMIANRSSVDMRRSFDPAYQQFAAAYQPCDLIADNAISSLTADYNPNAMASAWLETNQQLKDCSDAITAVLFEPQHSP